MTGDYSRQRFDPLRDMSGVLMQQGRVQLDADWNEQCEIVDRRTRAGTLDVVGRCGVPSETPAGFQIGVDQDGRLTIGRGRIYVDGILAENHGAPTPDREEFEPILAERRGTNVSIPMAAQPFVPRPIDNPDPGKYLIYVDVWTRELTFLEDPDLVEKAVGVDTTTRLQTVWQVKWLSDELTPEISCTTPDAQLPGWPSATAPSAARLTTGVVDVPNEQGPCLLPPTVGYRGLENRLYRVEIQRGGTAKKSTFKWSRDNASVGATVTSIPAPDKLTVDQTGRDAVMRFERGNWLEITDDWRVLAGEAGILRKIANVDHATKTITLTSPLTAGDGLGTTAGEIKARHTRIRRWDQSGPDADANQGALPVPDAGQSATLEDGIEVQFDAATKNGEFHVGDYWVFYARTVDASVEPLRDAPPRGIHHHFGRLALASFDGARWTVLSDCRTVFPPLTKLTSMFYVSGDGQEIAPNPAQPALVVPLPQPIQVGVANVGVPGKSGPVAGANVRFSVNLGAGRLQGAANSAVVVTDANGIASCAWSVDSTTVSQQVEAVLLDVDNRPQGVPVRFNANLSTAARVSYEPRDCPTLADVTDVQTAIDRLCAALHGGGCCVTVGIGGDFQRLDEAIQSLLQKNRFDLCLCLLPGDHLLEGFVVASPNVAASVNLHIGGCGAGTRLRIAQRPWTIEGLNEFALTDLNITAHELVNPLAIAKCNHVSIRRCQFAQLAESGALLSISGARRVQLSNNLLSSNRPINRELPPRVLRGAAELSELMRPVEGRLTILTAAAPLMELADSPVERRKELATIVRRNIEGPRREIPAEDAEAVRGFLEVLEADLVEKDVLADRFDRAFFIFQPGLALMLEGVGELGLVDHNTLYGAVSLYGMPGDKDLNVNQLKQLGLILVEAAQLAPQLFSGAQGTLRFEGNRLTRFVLSEAVVQRLADLPRIVEAHQPVESPGMIARLMYLADNIIDAGGNQLFGMQQSFTANSFSHQGQAEGEAPFVGWTASQTALFQGNQAPLTAGLKTALRNVSGLSFPKPKSTSNFILEIMDVGN